MLRGNRSELTSLVGAGLIALAIVGWSGTAALQAEQYKTEQSAQQAEAEERRAVEAFLLNPREQAIATETRARRQQDRERRDLDAQWATANWTLAQAVVGVLSLIGLAFTVYFAGGAWRAAKKSAQADFLALNVARRQLEEARNAASEATEISKGQSRAYVRVTGATYDPPATIEKDERDRLFPQGRINVHLENFGATVARHVVIRCEAIGAAQAELRYAEPSQFQTRPTSIAPSEKYSDWFRPNDGIFTTPVPADAPWCLFRGEVRYSDIYKKRFRSRFVMVLYRGVVVFDSVHEFRRPTQDVALAVFDPVKSDTALGDPDYQ